MLSVLGLVAGFHLLLPDGISLPTIATGSVLTAAGFSAMAAALLTRCPGPFPAFVLFTLFLVTSGLLAAFFLVVPRPARTVSLLLEEKFFPDAGPEVRRAEATATRTGTSTSGHWLTADDGSRPIPPARPVQVTNRPEVTLFPKTDADREALLAHPIYLRRFALVTFDEESEAWSPLRQPPQVLVAEDGWVDLAAVDRAKGPLISYNVAFQTKAARPLLLGIPHLVRAEIPFLRRTNSARFVLPPAAADATVYQYQAVSAPVRLADVSDDAKPAAAAPAFSKKSPLPGLEPLLKNLPLAEVGSLRTLRQRLRSLHQYSLDPKPQVGLSPLTNFLTGSREGYCEHFASTAVLAARQLGFPARLAYGWTNGRHYPSRDMIVFRARNAHAWAEVKVAGVGWVPFEVTPPAFVGRGSGSEGENEPAPTSSNDTFVYQDEEAIEERRRQWFLRGLLALLGVLLARTIWTALKRRKTAEPAAFDALGLVPPTSPDHLRDFQQHCRDHDHPIHAATTLRHYLTLFKQPPESWQALVDYHYRITYQSIPADPELARRLSEAAVSAEFPRPIFTYRQIAKGPRFPL